MGLYQQFMDVYRFVFHPFVVVAATALALAYFEWRRDGTTRADLATRAGAVGAVVLVGLAPVGGFLLFTGRWTLATANVWYVDLLTVTGLLAASAAAWTIWSRRDWGRAVPGVSAAVVVTAVPFAAVSLVWNVSGHVTFTAVPTLYLALWDRRFWPLLAIPVVMVVNRPVVEMHTWLQSVGGFVLGVLGVVVAGALVGDPVPDGALTRAD